MEENLEENVGLSTKEAISALCKDVELVLHQFRLSQKHRKSKSWLYDALHHKSQHTTINWISTTMLIISAILLITASEIKNDSSNLLIYEGLFILLILSIGLAIELHDNKLRHNEIPNRIKVLLRKIRTETKNVSWQSNNYPHLYSPFSPCITLQWTYRDNKLVNLPWALLVKEDIVLIRPGQVSPGFCESLDKHSEFPLLHAKEIYAPTLQNHNEMFSVPKARKPLEAKKYKLKETPYVNNLRIALDQALDKPITPQNQQRHLLMIKFIERLFLPLTLLVITILNSIRFLYLEQLFGKSSSVDLFILIPTAAILPLLPLVFPIVWNILNYWGMARFKHLFESTIQKRNNASHVDFCEEQEHLQYNYDVIKFDLKSIWTNFLDIFLGKEYILNRSSNILHVLGSVTALCCVDKKGILSWPNPTAEKIFFLHNANASESESLANLGDLHADGDTPKQQQVQHQSHQIDGHFYYGDKPIITVAEVLDITHDQSDPYKLHFDDTRWHEHINCLKPLGLAVLLNTCNVNTQEQYTQFCSHITCEAMYNENLVPVTNRRCLCELAKEIGFLEEAQKVFNLELQLSTFRHLQPEMVRRDNKFARSLSMSTKLKFPFPHMFAVIVKELHGGSMQLLSQGTADIILDSCVDFWDGHDLCPLTPSDRKKIQDFYQRSSLTAYCTAFAYRPLSRSVNEKLGQVYLELPSDSRQLYHSHRSPTPTHWECRSVLDPKLKQMGQFYSTDSLLCNDCQCSEISDAEGCFEMHCNQIFIGMVTMQYQAQADMVHLIEQLESACIRFVHFSKENELRSRVFSEKMGLESGWNCHISLLSERNSNLQSSRTMSFSAPSAINIDHSVVKFDTEHEHIHAHKSLSDQKEEQKKEEHKTSHDSLQMGNDWNSMVHDWQSLSCLTDSTEQSAPINFDMSNRAKLPRGIDKIRPHIELIDNVPLLVSLFTDCTATVTREMLHIMQDYGEVVCVIGSSANCENIGIFMQADASIALEPLYPQVCQKHENIHPINPEMQISPIELSRALNSIASSLSARREDSTSIFNYVMDARHYMYCLWNSVQFWLCCCIAITFLQIFTVMFMLPQILTTGEVMWLCYVIVPFLSVSLMAIPIDQDIMKKPQGKNQIVFNIEVILFVIWCYGIKFLPVILSAFLGFIGVLINDCQKICFKLHYCTCKFLYLPIDTQNSTLVPEWSDAKHENILYSAQNFTVFIIVINLAAVSVSFVHRSFSIWHRRPFNNFFWLCTVFVMIIIQTIYFLVQESENDDSTIPSYFTIIAFISPIFTFMVNEVLKREEIKTTLRHQRRMRLDFGTKLGMNSPF